MKKKNGGSAEQEPQTLRDERERILKQWWEDVYETYKDLAERLKTNPSTIRSWLNGVKPNSHHLAVLIDWLYSLKDLETKKRPEAAEVLDWLALLNVTVDEVFDSLKGMIGTEAQKKWLEQAINDPLWRDISLPTSYVERDCSEALIDNLITLKGYRQPKYRAVVLRGSPGSGKRTLATAITGLVKSHFRNGVIWLNEKIARELLCVHAQMFKPGIGGNEFVEQWWQWWQWFSSDTTVGLVILHDINDWEIAKELLMRAGSQVRFLIIVKDQDTLSPALYGFLNKEEVSEIALGGFTLAEGEKLVSKLWPTPLTNADQQYVKRLLQNINHPGPLRLLIAEACNVGWETVWQWVWKAQDSDTPLAGFWKNFLDHYWRQLDEKQAQWLRRLAKAIEHGGSLGEFYAACIWGITEQDAANRLLTLERRGWLEQIDEVSRGTPQKFEKLLGESRYRLVREGWEFLREQPGDQISALERGKWFGSMAWRFRKMVQLPWGSSFWAVALAYGSREVAARIMDIPDLQRLPPTFAQYISRESVLNANKFLRNPAMPSLQLGAKFALSFFASSKAEEQLNQMAVSHHDLLIDLWQEQGTWPPEEIWLMLKIRELAGGLPEYGVRLGQIPHVWYFKLTAAVLAACGHSVTLGWQKVLFEEYKDQVTSH